ncbi:hypothetical protein [Vibrio harveyi]|uniref:hypothetical protein n=1 Tax=Vibrio harveyi TaxID=669 RepID=UPI00068075A7|nr:hypothetical protein [Vibrio harveyi]
MNIEDSIADAREALQKTIIPEVNRFGYSEAISDYYETEVEANVMLNFVRNYLESHDVQVRKFHLFKDKSAGGRTRFAFVAYNDSKIKRYKYIKLSMWFSGVVVGAILAGAAFYAAFH